jgi:hypothetical protein
MPIKVKKTVLVLITEGISFYNCFFFFSQASADKIIREIELFGPDFEHFETVQQDLERAVEEKEQEQENIVDGLADKSKGKKGKLVAKATGLTYQFQIMESIGVPRAEIKKFADPFHWLTYFPPIAIVSTLLRILSRIELNWS